ncbi:hypothetical protein KKA95_00515, partial [Patescibacteria group bacterium]|nr:hypothetical protein [Patescibacteria group bacterium]
TGFCIKAKTGGKAQRIHPNTFMQVESRRCRYWSELLYKNCCTNKKDLPRLRRVEGLFTV